MKTNMSNVQVRLEAIFNHALDAILLVDNEARFVDGNPAACALLGYSREELQRLTVGDITPAPQQQHYLELWQRFMAVGHVSGVYVLHRKDRSTVEVDYRAVANITPGLHLGIIHDITAQRTAELEQARLLGKLQGANEELQLLTHRVLTVQEQERRRIARELHDEAAQALTAMKIILQSIEEDLPEKLTQPREQLKGLAELTDTTMEGIRRLAQDLRPPSLDTLSLDRSLAGLCDEFQRRTGLAIEYVGRQIPPQSDETNVCLYRVLQEALTNVTKHAAASRVRVHLQQDTNGIMLTVADDGRGFEKLTSGPTVGATGGLGLIGMRERLQLMNGSLLMESNPGNGTRLVANIPRVVS